MYKQINNLNVDEKLFSLINEEIIPQTTLNKDEFWKSFENIIEELTPQNRALLSKRDEIQEQIDSWHKTNKYEQNNLEEYKNFLKEIGYLVEEKENFKVETQNVDEEIKLQAGPQLVVPVKNARFALNAANARWGSLYDALYGTDVIPTEGEFAITKEYNETRGKAVVTYAKEHLDTVAPLKDGSHKDVISYKIVDGKLEVEISGKTTTLEDNSKLVAYEGEKENLKALVFKNNNLHVIVEFDKESFIGKLDVTGIKDVVVESADRKSVV